MKNGNRYFVGLYKTKMAFYKWIDSLVMIAFEEVFRIEVEFGGIKSQTIKRFLNKSGNNEFWKNGDFDFKEDQLSLSLSRLIKRKKIMIQGRGKSKLYTLYKRKQVKPSIRKSFLERYRNPQ